MTGAATDDRGDLDLAEIRRRLEAERDELASMSATAAEDRRPVALDQQSVGRLSRMDALQVQAMAIASEERRQARLRRIDAALRRLEEGEYGFCAGCGEPIPAKRLETDLTGARCIRCAQSAQ